MGFGTAVIGQEDLWTNKDLESLAIIHGHDAEYAQRMFENIMKLIRHGLHREAVNTTRDTRELVLGIVVAECRQQIDGMRTYMLELAKKNTK